MPDVARRTERACCILCRFKASADKMLQRANVGESRMTSFRGGNDFFANVVCGVAFTLGIKLPKNTSVMLLSFHSQHICTEAQRYTHSILLMKFVDVRSSWFRTVFLTIHLLGFCTAAVMILLSQRYSF